MTIFELRIWQQNDYGNVLIYFGITILDGCFVIAKHRHSGVVARLGTLGGRGWTWGAA